MFGQVYALLYEIWLRNRLGLIGIALLVPICMFAYPLLADIWSLTAPFVYFPLAGSLLYLTVMLSHGEFAGIPERNYLLPVRSYLLTLCPMLAGVVLIPCLYLAWSELILRPAGFQLSLLWPIAAIVTCSLWIQTAGWAFGRKPFLGMSALAVILTVIMITVGTATGGLTPPTWLPQAAVTGLFALMGPIAMLAAAYSVARIRIGEPLINGNHFKFLKAPPPPIPNPFSNACRAQLWYEWRMFGYLQPGIMLIICATLMVPLLLTNLNETAFLTLCGIMLMLFLQISFPAGLDASKSQFRSPHYGMTLFWATQPLSDMELAQAKLKMQAGTTVLSWLITMISIVLLVVIAGRTEQVSRAYTSLTNSFGNYQTWLWLVLTPIIMCVTAWIVGGCGMALGLAGKLKVIYGTVITLSVLTLLGIIAMMIYFKIPGSREQMKALLPYMMGGVTFALMIGLLFAMRVAHSWMILPKHQLIRVAAFAGPMLMLTAGFIIGTDMKTTTKVGWSLFCMGLVCGSLIPIVLAPMALRMNRHR